MANKGGRVRAYRSRTRKGAGSRISNQGFVSRSFPAEQASVANKRAAAGERSPKIAWKTFEPLMEIQTVRNAPNI